MDRRLLGLGAENGSRDRLEVVLSEALGRELETKSKSTYRNYTQDAVPPFLCILKDLDALVIF